MAFDPALEAAFHPGAIAVVGVSAAAKRGRRVLGHANFINRCERLGFKGHIYPVNPKADEIMGLKAYPTVSSIPEHVDLVMVSVPAKAVPSVLKDCIAAGARNIYVFTSGFEETGEEEGKRLGSEVREIARRGGLNVIGPNCMGLYVPRAGIGSFDRLTRASGPVAFVSQSGGYTNWFSHYAPNYGIRFSKVISYGNAHVLDVTDYLEYLALDPETKIILAYLEGVNDGRKLLRQIREINRVKPVILWKGGLTGSGSRAAMSHTGSLAGKQELWRAFYAQTGAVPVASLEEMADVTMAFLDLKPPRGNRVAIVGSGGGSAVASADVCAREGLEVPELTQKTQDELKKFVQLAGASIRNPLDAESLFGNISLMKRGVEVVAADPLVDMLIFMPHLDRMRVGGADQVDKLIEYLSTFAGEGPCGKPTVIVFQSWSNYAWEGDLRAKLEVELPRKGVVVCKSLAAAVGTLAKFYRYHRFQKELAETA